MLKRRIETFSPRANDWPPAAPRLRLAGAHDQDAPVVGEQDQKANERCRRHDDENRQARRGVQKSDAGRGERADTHLQKAERGRSAADILAERRDRDRRRVRVSNPAERQIEQQQDDIAGEAVPAIERADQNDQHDHVLADDGDAKDLVIFMPARQPNVQFAAADEAASKRSEDQAVGLRTDMKAVDENDRRAGDVDEQAGKRESPSESIGIKLRMDQDLAEPSRIARGSSEISGSGRWPSGSSKPITTMSKTAKAARMTNIQGQPMVVAIRLPIEGANSGDTL